MKSPDSIFNPPRPEVPEPLFLRIEILKRQFPSIGITCDAMAPIEKKIELCNTAEPSAMQFWPKNIDEMKKMAAGVKETACHTSIHLPVPRFNEKTGEIEQKRKEEIIEMLKQEVGNNFNVITMHLGWKDADVILNERGEWKETKLADKVADELADLLIAGIQSGKIMTLENIGHEEEFRETLGARPEHLIAARNKIAKIVADKTGISVDKVLSRIGYTFDMGHAVKNIHLPEQCSVETWLERIGEDIRLMHIHDVLPPAPAEDKAKNKRDHKPLGQGIVEEKIGWKHFFKLAQEHCPDVPMLMELKDDGDGAKTIGSVDYLMKLKQQG